MIINKHRIKKIVEIEINSLKGFINRSGSFIKNLRRTVVNVTPHKRFSKSYVFKKNYKYNDVSLNPQSVFTLRSKSIKNNYNLNDIKINPLSGFTLIEMLVVMGVLTLAVGATMIFLTSVLRGTQKANALNEVKQNSQIIVDSLEKLIRGAQDAENVEGGFTTMRLSSGAGEYTFVKCLEPKIGISNSRIGFAISSEIDDIPAENLYVSISNDDIKDGVEINDCTLTVFNAYGTEEGKLVPAVVVIEMDVLKQSERVDYSAETKIQTTISLRRY